MATDGSLAADAGGPPNQFHGLPSGKLYDLAAALPALALTFLAARQQVPAFLCFIRHADLQTADARF